MTISMSEFFDYKHHPFSDTCPLVTPFLGEREKRILHLSSEANARFPVFIIDDAQLLEHESLMDLCSLMAAPHKKSVAASVILVGDDTLTRRLGLHVMAPVSTRMTCAFALEGLAEKEVKQFVAFRLKAAKAPPGLFEEDTIALMAAHCRGNRRKLMNIATLLLDEAYFRKEKTIGAHLMLECDLIQQIG